jgi:arylformamidase
VASGEENSGMRSDPTPLIDITVPIRNGMFVYPDDPDVHLARTHSLSGGAPANVSRLDFGVHSGTHVDAPVHFIEGAPGAESIPQDALNGPVQVVDATALTATIDADAIARLELPVAERVLFKTRNSRLWDLDHFSEDFIALDGSGAQLLVECGIRCVGLDYLSIGDEAAHRALLSAGVVPLEALDLRAVQPGPYVMHCLSLRIEGSDGAPARALLEPA